MKPELQSPNYIVYNNFLKFFSVWTVPHTYVCDHGQMDEMTLFVEIDGVEKALHSPCKTDETVYCYVNRYREKTIILLYMVIFTCISISLTVAELIYVSTKYGLGTHRPYEYKTGIARKVADDKIMKRSSKVTKLTETDPEKGKLIPPYG